MENDTQKNNEEMFKASDVSVLLERIDHNVQIIAEGHKMLDEKIDRMEKNLIEKLDIIEGGLDTKASMKTVDEHEERIVKLEKAAAIA
ncbi:MAG: hypothetical protein WC238_03005 [Parcubacteria group bacterium]|jgi:ribosome assembly protein YihI (activator of Der GTPase)